MVKWPYNNAQWQELRQAKLTADPFCRACLERKITKPANHVDHILAIRNGGDPWEWTNLQSLCHSCHSRKTLHIEVHGQSRVPVKGGDVNGRPLDPQHTWNPEKGRKIARG
ncbi:MAG: HNH endonuclease signature motif containing protein [Nitrospirales bacterium]